MADDKMAESDMSIQCHQAESDENYEPVEKRRKFNSPIKLPVEYDKYDTTWTLKYSDTDLRAVELLHHSHVYVDGFELDYCERTPIDCKTLTSILMSSIFTENALSVCTLTGDRAANMVRSNPRPGLNEHAVQVLLQYVLQYGGKRNKYWTLQRIFNTVRENLLTLRAISNVRDMAAEKKLQSIQSGHSEIDERIVDEATRKAVLPFALPSEYDPNDTKWTLKYRNAGLGIVELLPSSGVYIDAVGLQLCLQSSNDCKTLAVLLLAELFTENALSVCTMTGERALSLNRSNSRPGLNEQAVEVLLQFVLKCGVNNNWCSYPPQAIFNILLSKLQVYRRASHPVALGPSLRQ